MFPQALLDKFWSRVKLPDMIGTDECWPWMAGCFSEGYGWFCFEKEDYSSHRLAWEIANNQKIPKGMKALHAPIVCHNKKCCNPDHIRIGTAKDNAADMKLDGTFYSEGAPHGERNGSCKLTDEKVNEVFDLLRQNISHSEIARRMKVSRPLISLIAAGKRRKKLTMEI